MSDSNLKILRDRIDEIDQKLQDLLNERAEISIQVKAVKTDKKSKLKPGRETQILRTIIDRQRGNFPKVTLIKIWREILSASVKLQGKFNVAIHLLKNKNIEINDMVDSVRSHFGTNTSIIYLSSVVEIIRSIQLNKSEIGMLGMPTNDQNFWWIDLIEYSKTIDHTQERIKIIAKLPIIFNPDNSTEYLIIAKSEPDPSGNDYTFFSAEARKKLTTGFIQEHLNTSNFCLEIIAKYNDNKKPNHFFYLLRANGFIKETDIEFKDLKLHSLENSLDLKILGNYANTIELN
tara:strand:- start:1355 stop:2224 length:870 start_codon:yes stop_codon:yes gene_type:complete